ncbi:MFS transporter [Mesorhizobium sp. KR9-304]|uniref:MFS transporter n=1 Tax=Mesorhizobium sp. KR9-304 TaxID=3156614 RepID=UPI0032B5CF64
MSERKVPTAAIWALGATQIVGYGTLYYSYSILAPAVAAELAWSQQWVFAILSTALLAGAVLAPLAGHWADRFGAGRLMVPGSIAAAGALMFCALAPGRIGFAIGVLAMELAACFVLYSTAFVAIVQLGGRDARRSITHLTLIAGFASTLFWPLTTLLHEHLDWRGVLMVFAGLNLVICLPVHAWLAWLARAKPLPHHHEPVNDTADLGASGGTEPSADGASAQRPAAAQPDALAPAPRSGRSPLFLLMLAGFAIEGFVLSAILVHMVPLMAAVGLGTAGVFVASLFGPSQVASRFINMLFGGGVRQTWLAFGATASLAAGLAVLLITAPSILGAVVFAILFGFGSGLMSIVGGTLPLELFGRAGYGAHVGWITAARQFSAAFAPFGLTFMMAGVGVFPALWINVLIGVVGIATFGAIALTHGRMRNEGGLALNAEAA